LSIIDEDIIWKSPVYHFVIPSLLSDSDGQSFKDIFIDVTDSVPPFDDPKDKLSYVLDDVLKSLPKKPLVLDYGAGKLRNTLYLLEKGCNVRAVEFEKIQGISEHAKKMYEKTMNYGKRFDKLVFPHEFFNSSLKFDLILLINVCNIMPVPAERLLVLQYCREKLKDDGLILYYNLHRDRDYVAKCLPDVAIGDGYYMKKITVIKHSIVILKPTRLMQCFLPSKAPVFATELWR
jgi:hypothetical protein